MTVRVGVDVGGTFTDSVCWRDGDIVISKVPTTVPQSEGVIRGIDEFGVAFSEIDSIFHGTTVGTNALIQRNGGPAALVLTAGFGDLLLLQRGDRPHLYDLQWDKVEPVIPRDMIVEAKERLDSSGCVVEAFNVEDTISELTPLIEQGIRSVGVCFLFAYLNDAHEQQLKKRLLATHPELYVSLSSEIAPEWRELERANTVAINAYLAPRLGVYLRELRERLLEARYAHDYFVMQSNGGMITSTRAVDLPCTTLLSGPAAGVQAAAGIAAQAGILDLLSFDMGGTSTDVCLIEGGEPTTTTTTHLERLPMKVRSLAVQAVGSGGGSIAYVDSGGRLQVGPESAGASPGPACYGRGGTRATISDAALVTGILDPDTPLGGDVQLDGELALRAISQVASELGAGATPLEASHAILTLAVDTIAHACRAASVEQGRDPRTLGLFAFGGAGPMFACRVAAELGIQRIIIPPYPGVTSALGLLMCPLRYDFSRTHLGVSSDIDPESLDTTFASLEQDALRVLLTEGFERRSITLMRSVHARYLGQNHELEIAVREGSNEVLDDPIRQLVSDFHSAHSSRYGFVLPERPVEIVTYRVAGLVLFPTVTLPPVPARSPGTTLARAGSRLVHFASDSLEASVYRRSDLCVKDRVLGPSLVVQQDTTVVVHPDFVAEVDERGNLNLSTME